jgi:hypothetical protein
MMSNIHGFNQIDEGTSDQVIVSLIQYIEDVLPEFPTSSEFVNILSHKKNENQHSLAFCTYMTHKCQSRYYFARENAQIGSHTIDMGVYYGSNLIFTFEAKLLPTPKGTKSRPRAEHEYVYGKGAGIQRFRDGVHGVDNQDNLFSENGIVAYIKEHDFEYWLLKVNQWILNAQWDESEQLDRIYFKQIAKLLSKHPRRDASEVTLHHFWIYVS